MNKIDKKVKDYLERAFKILPNIRRLETIEIAKMIQLQELNQKPKMKMVRRVYEKQ